MVSLNTREVGDFDTDTRIIHKWMTAGVGKRHIHGHKLPAPRVPTQQNELRQDSDTDTQLVVGIACIKRAVSLINDIDASKFPRLLSRILQKLHLRDERSFTEDEEEKLEGALGIEGRDLQLVLETTAFILELAAYHIAKPTVLSQQLQNIGLAEDKVAVFVKAWTSNGKSVLEKLRQRALAPNQLEEVNWRLNLQMSQSSKTKMKKPNAMFELVVNEEEGETDEEKQQKKIRMEFSHDELFEFYNKLESIQGQLDSLS